jgi:AraC-like DNA-binding protein
MTEPISLADLARATHTSPFHLSRLFRRHLGLPPLAYLRAVRLEQAAARLRDGDQPVTEVCYAVGFGGLSHFVTSFRTTYGVSPGAYRRGRGVGRSPRAQTAGRT